jgi:hypothetical protein
VVRGAVLLLANDQRSKAAYPPAELLRVFENAKK